MSVIFGIEESDVIILCGDKRSSTKEGTFIDDNMQKVTVINEHLAFVAAGNAAIILRKVGGVKAEIADRKAACQCILPGKL